MQWREQVAAKARARRAARAHKLDAAATPVAGSGVIETIAGSAPFQGPVKALQAGLGDPGGIAIDAAGNVYLSVPEFKSVLKVDSSSNVTVYAGRPLGIGPEGQSGDGGPATAATFVYPEGLVFDAAGNLYIADPDADTVRKINAGTGIITTVAGMLGQYGNTGDGGPATSAELDVPTSLALDGQGNLYIASGSVIRKVSAATGLISTVLGGADQAEACIVSATVTCPGTSMNINFTTTAATSLAAGPNYVYAMLNSYNGPNASSVAQIVQISNSNGQVTLIAGGGTAPNPVLGANAVGSTLLVFGGIALDGAGNLDIETDEAVLQLPANGTTLTTLAGTFSDDGYAGDGGPATSALLSSSTGIAVSPSGSILINDGARVRSISSGNISTIVGNGTHNFFGDGGPALQAGLSRPSDTAFDGQGNLYIADTGNNLIRKVDAVSGVITSVWGNAVYDPDFSSGMAVPQVIAMAIDDATHMFLSTTKGILLLDLNTGDTSVVAEQEPSSTHGQMIFDGDHTLYQADFGEILITNTADGEVSANEDVFGPLLYGVALDGAGNLYYSNTCTIWVFNLSTRQNSQIAGGSSANSCSHGGDGGPAINAPLYFPTYLRLDGVGNLLIAEADGVRSINLETGIITTVAGSMTLGFSGDGGNADAAEFDDPNSVTLDASGNLYIADMGNGRVRRVNASPLATTLTSALMATATSVTSGTSVTLTATYVGAAAGTVPTGTVTFFDGAVAIGTELLSAGAGGAYVATLTDGSLAVGSHSVTAQYSGDAHYAPNTSAAVVVTVAAPLTNLAATLTASSGSVTVGAAVTVTASFTGAVAGVVPTGMVNFLDGATSLGSGTFVAGASGAYVATLTNSTLTTGTHSITAQYAGDVHYAAITTAAVTITVTAAAAVVPSFGLTASATTVTFVQGTSATAVLTLTPQNAFDQVVTFGCVGTALAGTTPGGAQAVSCTFAPATITTSGTTAATTTVTFSAAVGAASLAFPPGMPADDGTGRRWLPGGGAAALACLLMIGLPAARRRTQGLWIAIAGFVLVAGMGLGCGSGSTAPQSALYPEEVTATVGTGATAVSQSVMVFVMVTK